MESQNLIYIYIYDFELDTLLQLTKDPGSDFYPAWTKNGDRLTFFTDRDYPDERGRADLYEIDTFGDSLKRITTDGNVGSFLYNPENQSYLIKPDIEPFNWYSLDATTLDTIQNPPFSVDLPPSEYSFNRWSFSGKRILLSTYKNGLFEYYVLDVEDNSLVKLNFPKNTSGVDIR